MLTQNEKDFAKEAATSKLFRKYKTPESLAIHILQGWAFTGVTSEEHEKDVTELVNIIKVARQA